MTDQRHDPAVHALLERLPTPGHRPGFWDELENRLAGTPTVRADRTDGAPPDRLRSAARHDPSRIRTLALVAASVLAVVFAASLAIDRNGTATVGTADTQDPAAAPTDPTDPPPTTFDAGDAQAAALAWLNAIAAGDLASAWDVLGPDSRAGWGTFENFESARSGFAEGFGLWASAVDRTVGTAKIPHPTHEAAYVVTISGTRTAEGATEDSAVALVVITDGTELLVEPFSPASAGITFLHPPSDETPGRLDPDAPVQVSVPSDGTLFFIVDHDTEVVEVEVPAELTGSFTPDSGWSPGRHVVTAVLASADGSTVTSTTVFDVP